MWMPRPMPCKEPCWVSQDDFFSQSAKPMWGSRGRGDLEATNSHAGHLLGQVMKLLGANAVREGSQKLSMWCSEASVERTVWQQP